MLIHCWTRFDCDNILIRLSNDIDTSFQSICTQPTTTTGTWNARSPCRPWNTSPYSGPSISCTWCHKAEPIRSTSGIQKSTEPRSPPLPGPIGPPSCPIWSLSSTEVPHCRHCRSRWQTDSDKLLMTPFEYGIVPPPYCAFTINFETNVSFVSLPTIPSLGDNDSVSCFVQLSNNACKWLRLTRKPDANNNRVTVPTTLQFGTSHSLYTPIVAAVHEYYLIGCRACFICD